MPLNKRHPRCRNDAVGNANRVGHDRVAPSLLLVHIGPRRLRALRLGFNGSRFTKLLTYSPDRHTLFEAVDRERGRTGEADQ